LLASVFSYVTSTNSRFFVDYAITVVVVNVIFVAVSTAAAIVTAVLVAVVVVAVAVLIPVLDNYFLLSYFYLKKREGKKLIQFGRFFSHHLNFSLFQFERKSDKPLQTAKARSGTQCFLKLYEFHGTLSRYLTNCCKKVLSRLKT